MEPKGWQMPISRFAMTLIALDLLCILIFVAVRMAVFASALPDVPLPLRLEYAYGVPASFNYLKLGLTVAFLALAWRGSGQMGYALLAVLFAILLIDDMVEVHEWAGMLFRSSAGAGQMEQFGLRSRDFGELLAFAALGLLVAGMMVLGLMKSDRQMRRAIFGFALLLVALSFFGVVVDMLQILLKADLSGTARSVVHVVTLVTEEGGEMIVCSLICAYALQGLRQVRQGVAPLYLQR